ncbi:MAG: Hsp20/alpha crystallin family protein [Methanobacteriota archaeon]|nr:MAG: Hsp20/alpha crystallin family protein [Euryarchaeota archaeon]
MRRKRSWSLFDEFEKIRELMEDMVEEMMYEMNNLDKEGNRMPLSNVKPKVYGVNIEIGPEGDVKVNEFGDVKQTIEGIEEGKEELIGAREPIVEVHKEGDEVLVVAEMPGVHKDDIEIKTVGKDELEIKVDNKESSRKYYKKLKLPHKIDKKSIRVNYKNGIMEMRAKLEE